MAKASEEILEMLIKQLNKNPSEVTEDKRIKEDLWADSLDVIEILMTIEDKYGIRVPDETVMSINTVGDIVKDIGSIIGERIRLQQV